MAIQLVFLSAQLRYAEKVIHSLCDWQTTIMGLHQLENQQMKAVDEAQTKIELLRGLGNTIISICIYINK